MQQQCLLYLISPPLINDIKEFSENLKKIFEIGGEHVGAFQLRLKKPHESESGRLTDLSADEDIIAYVSDIIRPVCQQFHIPFIMNDSAILAQKYGADGVHLGQEDGDVTKARAIVGENAIIGISCHASRHLAMIAGEAGADYVAFGAFYPTASKSAEALQYWGVPDLEILEWWTADTVLPCVAIGGITPYNAVPLIEAGADFIAIISSIWDHAENPVVAVQEFITILEQTKREDTL